MERSSAGSCSVVTSCPKSFQAAMVSPHKKRSGGSPPALAWEPEAASVAGEGPATPRPGGGRRVRSGGAAGYESAGRKGGRGRAPSPPGCVAESGDVV